MARHSQENEKCRCNNRVDRVLTFFPLVAIKAYRYGVSPMIGKQCRFYPSCSAYAEESFSRFGFVKGAWLTGRRLIKCHPWHDGGFDPVPEE